MKVFIAGATGAIGQPLVERLLNDGHHVTAITRSPKSAAQLQERGVKAAVVDVFEREKLCQVVMEAQPDVVMNQLTSIPDELDVRKIAAEFAETNRLRTEGNENLLDAARAGGASQYIAQSFIAFYTPEVKGLATEDQPLYLDAPDSFVELVKAIVSLEDTVLNAPGITGTVLRYGNFYGPGTSFAGDAAMANIIRQRQMPIIGRGNGTFSFIHVEDAADATVLAMEHNAPGIYNIVDDDPAPLRKWLPVYAELLRAPKPMQLPKLIGRLLAGRYAIYIMNEQRGASNKKAKQALGWQPEYASWRDGFRAELGTV